MLCVFIQYLWFQQHWCWGSRCPGPTHTCPEWLEDEGTTVLPNDRETLIEWCTVTSWFQTFAMFWMLHAFFWVIPQRLNFVRQRFGTPCLFHLHRWVGMKKFLHTYPSMKMEQRLFWNVGILSSDAGELPRRKHTTRCHFPKDLNSQL